MKVTPNSRQGLVSAPGRLQSVGPLPQSGQNVTVATIQDFGEGLQLGIAANQTYQPLAAPRENR